ncbi:MAG: hypothetical protein NC416_10270 [Eubacterium sp.]|nr:hypothetical protein [Eubacterium sp.]
MEEPRQNTNQPTREQHGNTKGLSSANSQSTLFLKTAWFVVTRPLNLIIYGISWLHLYFLCQFGNLRKNIPILFLCLLWWIGAVGYGLYLWRYYCKKNLSDNSESTFAEIRTESIKWYSLRKGCCQLFLKDKSVITINLPELDSQERDFLTLKLSTVRTLGKRSYQQIASVLLAVVTLCGSFLVVRSALPYHGELSWYLDDLQNKKSVTLVHDNLYESGIKGILDDIRSTVNLPETLCLATSFNLHFAPDGTIQTFDTMLYGYDNNDDFMDSYLITYNAARSKRIDIYLHGSYGAAFDIDKDLHPLIEAVSIMPIEETVAEWSGEKTFGILYYGTREWNSPEGIRYLNYRGDSRIPAAGEYSFSGYSVSVFCPDNEAIVPVRYLYRGYLDFAEEDTGYLADYYPTESVYAEIDKINEYKISEQSFDVWLDGWGAVTFVSCMPPSHDYEDASFFLVKDDRILYEFPDLCEDNNTIDYRGMFDRVGAVGFRDVNGDQKNDIIVITYYSELGKDSIIPRSGSRIFIAEDNEFTLAEDMIADVEKHIAEKDFTIDNIYQYLLHRNVGNENISDSTNLK